ncbi:MAG: Na+/H+ antiporter NhaA [Chloroflexi bacterium]|nr:Na+/H+ antiporter NhaA [Chloroflexota bacterium]MCI0648096.1 Na+/H+ antiporter NhaA [Chloroflexota bacterium]
MEGNGSLPPRLTLPVGDRDHTQGPAGAPITLVEYGDYQCPYCRQVYHTVRELQEVLGDRLQYVYRHLPISTVHPYAQLAAEAAEAAGAQGKFWEMHEALFEHDELDEASLIQYAADIGLDADQFRRDLAEHRYAGKVEEDFRSGIRSGVNGTPTFFVNGERYDGAWDLESLLETVEKPLGMRVRLLAQVFTSMAAAGGIVLLLCTLVALIWANSPWSDGYFHLWEMTLGFSAGRFSLARHLLEWVNDGLMVIFFVVVGLEIKREVTVGELASPRRAALPIAGAVGGMVLPAAIYTAFNAGGPGAAGWGIPMATDIAFTLGILTVLGRRVPLALRVFFTALAIADDLGAVLVIALFYNAGISWFSLGVGLTIFLALLGLNRARVYSALPYGLLGIGLWLAFLQSGIHPSIAGVLLAVTIPTRSPPNIRGLLAQTVALLNQVELQSAGQSPMDGHRQATLQTLETITDRMQSPAQHLERALQPWSTYLILPLFALANAGVALVGDGTLGLLNPAGLGIILGLVLGKPLGISLFSWAAVRLGLAEKPGGLGWGQFFSASCLAGIGFTISLFFASTAFDDLEMQAAAKLAILVASMLASVIGSLLLAFTSPGFRETTPMGSP